MATPRQRRIPLSSIEHPNARRTLAESKKPGCKRCVDGIEKTGGKGTIVICRCAFDTFTSAIGFAQEEKRRRKAGMAPRLAKLENGRFDAPAEVGLDLAAREFSGEFRPPLDESDG